MKRQAFVHSVYLLKGEKNLVLSERIIERNNLF